MAKYKIGDRVQVIGYYACYGIVTEVNGNGCMVKYAHRADSGWYYNSNIRKDHFWWWREFIGKFKK